MYDGKDVLAVTWNQIVANYWDQICVHLVFKLILIGDKNHLLPIHKEEHLQSGYFAFARKVIAVSAVQGGTGLVGLSRALSHYLVTTDITSCLLELTISDVPDFTVHMCLQEVWYRQSDLCDTVLPPWTWIHVVLFATVTSSPLWWYPPSSNILATWVLLGSNYSMHQERVELLRTLYNNGRCGNLLIIK